MTKRTTLNEIAKAAGVSIATVDRVVNRRGGVSPRMEARVLEWASRLKLDRRIFRAHLPTLRIAVMIPSPANPFFAAMRDAFKALEGVASDVQFRLYHQFVSPTEHLSIAKKIGELSSYYDGVIICCPDAPEISDAISLISRDIPVVTLVTDLPSSGRLAYVGPDNRQIGRVAGELMGRFLGPAGGEVLVMIGNHRMVGHQEREIGFRAVTRERYPNVVILDIVESEEDSERAAKLARYVLETNPEIRGIYNVSAGNYEIAQTLAQLGRTRGVVFITHELTERRREMLRSGLLDAVIDQNPRMEARRAIEILASFFNRNEQVPLVDGPTPFEIFLRENSGSAGNW